MFPATASQYSMTALNELHIIFLNASASKLRNISVPPWNDGHQMLLQAIFPPSHILSKSAIGLSISFSPVKVCFVEQALRDPYLIR